MLSRRNILTGIGASGFSLLAGCSNSNGQAIGRGGEQNLLQIPPLYSGKRIGAETVYDLKVQNGMSRFLEGRTTPTLGINQNYLGPTLAMNIGDKVRLNVTNTLLQSTTMHWHGFHLPARYDGNPHQAIAPGATWIAQFEVRQQPSLFWYHAHPHRRAGSQVYHGLAGGIYVRDPKGDIDELPQDYGIDDIPLIVQDRAFARNGNFVYVRSMHDIMNGMMGNTMLVNGVVNPAFDCTSDRLRLRLLNGSNARFYRFRFEDWRGFQQISSDGGLLPAPVSLTGLILAPGERADILVDVSDGVPAQLLADTLANSAMGMMGGRMGRGMMGRGMGDSMTGQRQESTSLPIGRRSFKILTLRPGEQRRRALALLQSLASLSQPDATKAIRTRRLVLDMGMMGMMGRGGGGAFTINGKSMAMDRIDIRVKRGTSEIWQIENASPMAHPFHIHDVQFRILDRNGRPPQPAEQGLKDTVLVHSGETVRLLLGFTDYADPDIPYMYHCHMLEHEDAGMMGQFTVEA